MSVVLISNNPLWRAFAAHWPSLAPGAPFPSAPRSFIHVDDSPLAVLLESRRFIHAGWRLRNHPLYGNFRPHQQPYRTLLSRSFPGAARDDGGVLLIEPDETSLRLLEEALSVYRNGRVLSPGQAPPALREACSLLDFELMRPTLDQEGWSGEAPAA